jgi:glutamate dehydrogenase/leucine dehydrogenase
MTRKCALAGLPDGGGKTGGLLHERGIVWAPEEILSAAA